MKFIKYFIDAQERQSCTDTYKYLSYTVEDGVVNIHYEPFFCKLYQQDGSVVEIEGSGELTSAMTSQYSATTVSAEIGNLCTSIGDNAFLDIESRGLLTKVDISNSVTSIGEWAFSFCTRLTSITIGSGVTSIGMSAFYGCESLTSITIPDSVTSIDENAFYSCYALTSVTIGNSVTSIGQLAFAECSKLTNISIGSGVTSIGLGAFDYCSSLTSITSLATTAPTIQSDTFHNVKANGTLYVPQGSSGYDTWMGTGNYYLGKYSWTKVEQ